jgi:ATP-binding cassette, subfamily F, member 3
VFKSVAALSGGERGRLALAKIMYVGGNLLLLDEPTNHLDVYTREALEEAIDQFTGALVVVSHDRYFIDRVAEQVIVVEDGVAEVHYGNYSELVEKFKREAGAVAAARIGKRESKAAAPVQLGREDQKRREKRLRKVEEELGSIEERIAVLEGQREENDRLLCSEEIYRDGEKTREIQSANASIARQIEQLYERWEELTRERETLEVGVA